MTLLQAAYIVLKRAGRAMHFHDIYEEVVSRDLWKSAALPQNIDNSVYGTLIKAVQAGDHRFSRIDGGPSFIAR